MDIGDEGKTSPIGASALKSIIIDSEMTFEDDKFDDPVPLSSMLR